MNETIGPVRRQRGLVRRTAANARAAGVASAPPQEERAAPTREARTPDDQPTRRSRFDTNADRLSVPQRLKKPGWDYQWMVTRVTGQEVDPSEMTSYYEQGWRPAQAKDYPDMCPPNWEKTTIEQHGQMLMVRPMRLTMEARQEDLQAAEAQRRDKLVGAAQGRAADGGLASVRGVVPHTLAIEIEGEVGTYNSA